MSPWIIAVAAAAPLQVEAGSDPAWVDHARMAGFEVGPCSVGPCARVRDGSLELVHADGAVEPIAGGDVESTLAIAASRLVLAAAAPGRGAATRPVVRAPAPPPVPEVLPRGPHAEGVVERVLAPPERIPAAGAAPEVHVVEPQPAVPSRSGSRRWHSVALGLGRGPVLSGHVGAEWRGWWLGVGGRFDGALGADVGAGRSVALGRWRGRLGLWGGADWQPAECVSCEVDVSEDSNGTVTTVTAGPFPLPIDPPGWGAVIRAELEAAMPLGRGVHLAPRTSVALRRGALRPEVALALRWTAQ